MWDGVGDPLDYVISVNLHRRQLNKNQRGLAAARIANLRKGQRSDGSRDPSESVVVTCDQAAVLCGVSRPMVIRARTILRDGTAAEIAAIEHGTAPYRP
jgi:hypothetical protein